MDVEATGQRGYLFAVVLLTTFALVAIWETLRPERPHTTSTGRRWFANAALFAASQSVARLVFAAAAILTARGAAQSATGLLPKLAAPAWIAFPLTFLLLDLSRYVQHLLFHRIAFLWRFHQVHHSDPDYDLTTGIRFHPVEALFTQAGYLGLIVLLAPPPAAVAAVEIATIIQNFLAHANASFPPAIERLLRPLLVTPDLHRVHHSDEPAHYNRNLASLFSCWDRLFGTYIEATPSRIGLSGQSSTRPSGIIALLLQPFRRFEPRA